MIDYLLQLTALSTNQLLVALAVVFAAGIAKGFSGFALSALVIASLALMIPPVELIAICWFLEMAASALMMRGGIKEANKSIVLGLVIGSACGAPIGLYLTNSISVSTSKGIALALILGLAAMQLLKVRPAFLATTPGLYASGFMAGIATGLASVGGMIVALYVLARDAPAKTMRGSLVMFLFVSSTISLFYLYAYGMMTGPVIARGLVFSVPCVLGVIAGKALFRPALEPYYKPFCLALLMLLAVIGLIRLAL